MTEWYRQWWAMPAFNETGRSINRWAYADVSDTISRPTENTAFNRLYSLSEAAKEIRLHAYYNNTVYFGR